MEDDEDCPALEEGSNPLTPNEVSSTKQIGVSLM